MFFFLFEVIQKMNCECADVLDVDGGRVVHPFHFRADVDIDSAGRLNSVVVQVARVDVRSRKEL